MFTLEGVRCLGACGLAPVMMVDEEVFGRLTPKRAREILRRYRG
jgi:NADH:ubiquinone oxidoreductase subunit E